MGHLEILEKLKKELNRDIQEESQVVYILSRIRKYLEQTNLHKNYKYIIFYCNWALHSKLDRTEPVSDLLREVTVMSETGVKFLTFQLFHADLKKFFRENSIQENILDKQWLKFTELLIDIYSDTPVEFYPEDKRTLTIRRPAKPPTSGEISVAYQITPTKN